MTQLSLFNNAEEEYNPAQKWNEEAAKRSLDELFHNTCQYRSSQAYLKLINFVSQFRFYSPYNAMLLHIQMPGAQFVAPASRWLYQYGRFIKMGAHPLVILQPMGPVMFVFDVSDTEPGENAKPLPKAVEKPFEGLSGKVGDDYERTIENAKRDGIRITISKNGSQSAGSIRIKKSDRAEKIKFSLGKDRKTGEGRIALLPIRYEMLINETMGKEARYATIVHELAHLYCGHIGTPNKKWWPDRRGLSDVSCEFEAESVAHLVCVRLGLIIPTASYLSGYLQKNDGDIPPISLECVLKVSGLIEIMGEQAMKLRKE